ncbi:MAG TPA: GspMb/PilO family protein [Candidatus Ozemobacteraceae bacterium]
MDRGDRAVLLFVASCTGILLLLAGGAIWFPKLWSERRQSLEIMSRLQDKQTLETQAQTFFNDLRARGDRFNAELARLESRLEAASFTPRHENAASDFVAELQQVITPPGVTLITLSYQSRILEDQFLTLPFEARFECDYPGLRRLLQTIETHPAGIYIERLEFPSFDNERRRLVLKLSCKVRFSRG